jgi:hypothetical protein
METAQPVRILRSGFATAQDSINRKGTGPAETQGDKARQIKQVCLRVCGAVGKAELGLTVGIVA